MDPRRFRRPSPIARAGLHDLVGLVLAYIIVRAIWLAYDPGPTWAFILTMIGLWIIYRIIAMVLPDAR